MDPILLAVAVVESMVVVICLIVTLVLYKQTPNNKIQDRQAPANDDLPANEDSDLLQIEYVPAVLCASNMFLFIAAANVHTELLAAGDELLNKLPISVRDALERPISCDLTALLAQGGDPNDRIPERVRAAIAVAETVLALWILISDYEHGVCKPVHPAAINKCKGVIIVGAKEYPIKFPISQICRSVGVSMAAAGQIWRCIVEILREGFVPVPGIRAKKFDGLSKTA